MYRPLTLFFSLALLILSLGSCDSDPRFTINGKIEGIGSRPLTLTYFAGGKIHQLTATPVDDSFTFTASSPEPSLATVTMADGTLCASLIVNDGQEIKLVTDPAHPENLTVEGSSDSEKLARWLRENHSLLTDSTDVAINRAITRYVTENSSDITSTALLSLYFRTRGHEAQADSLLSLISPKARPQAILQNFNATLAPQLIPTVTPEPVSGFTVYFGGDSLRYISTRSHTVTLLAFIGPEKKMRDTIIPKLTTLHRIDTIRKRMTVAEISTASDSATWQSSIAKDSAAWSQSWTPAAIMSPAFAKLGIPGIPYFILVDNEGQQIYRGKSITTAIDSIHSRTNL